MHLFLLLTPYHQICFFVVGTRKNLLQPFKSAATSHATVLFLTMVLSAFFLSGTLPPSGTNSILSSPCFSGLGAYFPSSTCFFAISFVGLVVKASASRAEDPGFGSRLQRDFAWSSHTSDLKLALQWLPCQAPGVIGSVLGPVGPVSVYCDLVRWKVWSATSISVWQHVKLSEQIRP